MTKEEIQTKLEVAQTNFASLQQQGEAKRTELEQIEDELKRFQGEYRALQSLLDDLEKPKEANSGKSK